MRNFKCTKLAVAAVIVSFKGPFIVTDDDDHIEVGHAWLAQNMPRERDYLVKDGRGGYKSVNPRAFEADHKEYVAPEPVKPEGMNLRDALMALDIGNDEHWTDAGLPAMAAIEAFMGSDTVTRSDVDDVAPNFTRHQS